MVNVSVTGIECRFQATSVSTCLVNVSVINIELKMMTYGKKKKAFRVFEDAAKEMSGDTLNATVPLEKEVPNNVKTGQPHKKPLQNFDLQNNIEPIKETIIAKTSQQPKSSSNKRVLRDTTNQLSKLVKKEKIGKRKSIDLKENHSKYVEKNLLKPVRDTSPDMDDLVTEAASFARLK